MSYSPKFVGSASTAPSKSVGESVVNTGPSLNKATPIRIDSVGEIRSIDVSVEAEALATVGVATEDISNGSSGGIATNGRVENIVTTANNGDILYVSKTGSLTNVKPDVGVGGFLGGDFVIRIGVVVKNEVNPLLQDLLLSVSILGQL